MSKTVRGILTILGIVVLFSIIAFIGTADNYWDAPAHRTNITVTFCGVEQDGSRQVIHTIPFGDIDVTSIPGQLPSSQEGHVFNMTIQSTGFPRWFFQLLGWQGLKNPFASSATVNDYAQPAYGCSDGGQQIQR